MAPFRHRLQEAETKVRQEFCTPRDRGLKIVCPFHGSPSALRLFESLASIVVCLLGTSWAERWGYKYNYDYYYCSYDLSIRFCKMPRVPLGRETVYKYYYYYIYDSGTHFCKPPWEERRGTHAVYLGALNLLYPYWPAALAPFGLRDGVQTLLLLLLLLLVMIQAPIFATPPGVPLIRKVECKYCCYYYYY